MEHLKFLENTREADYCLLFSIGAFKGYAADLRECLGSLLLSWNVEAKEAA